MGALVCEAVETVAVVDPSTDLVVQFLFRVVVAACKTRPIERIRHTVSRPAEDAWKGKEPGGDRVCLLVQPTEEVPTKDSGIVDQLFNAGRLKGLGTADDGEGNILCNDLIRIEGTSDVSLR